MVSKAAIAATVISAKQKEASDKHAIQIAARKIDDMITRSPLFSRELDMVPKFGADELRMGRVLQRGMFGTARELRYVARRGVGGVDTASECNDALKDPELRDKQDKRFIADHCVGDGGEICYCVKVRRRTYF